MLKFVVWGAVLSVGKIFGVFLMVKRHLKIAGKTGDGELVFLRDTLK